MMTNDKIWTINRRASHCLRTDVETTVSIVDHVHTCDGKRGSNILHLSDTRLTYAVGSALIAVSTADFTTPCTHTVHNRKNTGERILTRLSVSPSRRLCRRRWQWSSCREVWGHGTFLPIWRRPSSGQRWQPTCRQPQRCRMIWIRPPLTSMMSESKCTVSRCSVEKVRLNYALLLKHIEICRQFFQLQPINVPALLCIEAAKMRQTLCIDRAHVYIRIALETNETTSKCKERKSCSTEYASAHLLA
jgi:hypothetical protein